MATLKQIAYNIAEIQGRAKDSTFIEQKKLQVEYTRSLLFRRDYERSAVIPIQMLQSLRGLDIIEVDAAELEGLDIGCKVYKTAKRIPAPMNLKGTNAFKYVGTIDMHRAYSYIDPLALQYTKFNRYDKSPLGYFYRDGHLYITSNPRKISISYILDEPSKLEEFILESGLPAFNDEMEYPIAMDMVQRVTATILATEGSVDHNEDDHEINVSE